MDGGRDYTDCFSLALQLPSWCPLAPSLSSVSPHRPAEWASDNTAQSCEERMRQHTWCPEDRAQHLEGSLCVFIVINQLINMHIMSDWRGPQKPAGTVASQEQAGPSQFSLPSSQASLLPQLPQKGCGQSAPGPRLVCSQYNFVGECQDLGCQLTQLQNLAPLLCSLGQVISSLCLGFL